MNRRLIAVMTLSICAAATAVPVAATTPTDQDVYARTTTSGEVGAFSFPDTKGSPGAVCVYNKGRLKAINLKAPHAGGRPQWDPLGQYVLWSARVQAKTGSAGWRSVGGVHYSEAPVRDSGQFGPLPAQSIPRVSGAPNTKYRVVETINWYFNDRNKAIVQGQATHVVAHYSSMSKPTSSCQGVTGTRLPPLRKSTNDELDAVKVSFAGNSHGARVRYSIKSGRLPQGLRLNAMKGVVTGRIPAGAVNSTDSYHNIQPKTFRFVLAAKANGQITAKSYSWVVYDTAFVMPSYYGLYGCDGDPDCSEPVPNISHLGPKIAFGCTTTPQPGIPANQYSVIYRQDYQKLDGSLASSAGLTFRYGDVFKWWYYNASC